MKPDVDDVGAELRELFGTFIEEIVIREMVLSVRVGRTENFRCWKLGRGIPRDPQASMESLSLRNCAPCGTVQ